MCGTFHVITPQEHAGTCNTSCASASFACSHSCHGSASPGSGEPSTRCRSRSGKSSKPQPSSAPEHCAARLPRTAAACAVRDTSCGVSRRGVDVVSDAVDCCGAGCSAARAWHLCLDLETSLTATHRRSAAGSVRHCASFMEVSSTFRRDLWRHRPLQLVCLACVIRHSRFARRLARLNIDGLSRRLTVHVRLCRRSTLNSAFSAAQAAQHMLICAVFAPDDWHHTVPARCG